ncbi:hypothetical protein KJ705_01545 [Patescibacteria group bacterium]|nr:hypothetical protein [Patescibacteria group bacterium]
MDINLLKDKEAIGEKSRKKTGGVGIELTRPNKEKDETKKRVKKGGMSEFFAKLFKRKKKERILSQKVVKKEEKVKKISHEKIKESKKIQSAGVLQVEIDKKTSAAEKLVTDEPSPTNVEKRELKSIDRDISEMESKPEILEKEEDKKPRKKFFTWSSPEDDSKNKKNIVANKKEDTKNGIDKKLTKVIPLEEKIQSLDVNLIPDDVLVKLEPKSKLRQLGLAVIIIAVLVGLIYGYMMYRESKIEGDIQVVVVEIESVEQELNNLGDIRESALVLKKQIDSVSQLLNVHIYWSQFLEYLEKYTLPDVYYKNLAATKAGIVTLSASAVDLATLADQYLIFQNASDFVESVTIESAVSAQNTEDNEIGSGAVDFNISLTINPDTFFLKDDLPL